MHRTGEELIGSTLPDASALLRAAAEVADRCAAVAAEADRGERTLAREFDWLRAAGLPEVVVPREYGGPGWGSEPGTWASLLRLLKLVGRGNLSVGRIFEGHINALQLIWQWGVPAQQRAAVEAVRTGALYGVWNTEAPGDGVSLEHLPGGRVRLHGAKTFASGASLLEYVFANGTWAGEEGWQMCLVPMNHPAVRREGGTWHPIGMRATESIRVDFSGVELGPEALFGQPGEYTRQPWFSGGAIRFAAVQLGGAEAVAEAARTFLRGLGRVDDPYQAARMGEMAALLETGQLWLEGAARRAEAAEEQPEELVAYAGLFRRTVERIGLEVMEHAVRSAGARALLQPEPLERLVRDLTMYLRQPVPDGVLALAGRFAGRSETPFDELWR